MTKEYAIQNYIDTLEFVQTQAKLIYNSLVMAASAIGHLPDGFDDWSVDAPKGTLLTIAGCADCLCKTLDRLSDHTRELVQNIIAMPEGGAAE